MLSDSVNPVDADGRKNGSGPPGAGPSVCPPEGAMKKPEHGGDLEEIFEILVTSYSQKGGALPGEGDLCWRPATDVYETEEVPRPGFARNDERFRARGGVSTYFADTTSIGIFLDIGGRDSYWGVMLGLELVTSAEAGRADLKRTLRETGARAVREVLGRTLGVPIFQEQVIKVAMAAAGVVGGGVALHAAVSALKAAQNKAQGSTAPKSTETEEA